MHSERRTCCLGECTYVVPWLSSSAVGLAHRPRMPRRCGSLTAWDCIMHTCYIFELPTFTRHAFIDVDVACVICFRSATSYIASVAPCLRGFMRSFGFIVLRPSPTSRSFARKGTSDLNRMLKREFQCERRLRRGCRNRLGLWLCGSQIAVAGNATRHSFITDAPYYNPAARISSSSTFEAFPLFFTFRLLFLIYS